VKEVINMICPACKYEHDEEFSKELMDYKTIIGDKKFIEVDGHFIRTRKYDYHSDSIEEVSLFACPKCGCVRMGNFDL
jgi:hypothetical protein